MSRSFEVVPFHQHEILTVREGDDILVPLKPLVDALGMAWNGQFERVNRHPVLSEGIRVTRIPSQGGMQESVALTLEMVPGFLVTMQADRIKDVAIRDRVMLFQREAFHVLFEYFFGGARRTGLSVTTVADVIKLIDALKRERNPAASDLLHQMLDQACAARGLRAPPLSELSPGCENMARCDALLGRIDVLIAEQPLIDHHRTEGMIAVKLPELARNGLPVPKDLRAHLRNHPRFMGERSVNSRWGRTVHCWVFRAASSHLAARSA